MQPAIYEFRYSRKKAWGRVLAAIFALFFVFIACFLWVKTDKVLFPVLTGLTALGVALYMAYRARMMFMEKNPLVVLTGDSINMLNKAKGWDTIYWHQVNSISFNRTTREGVITTETDATLTLHYTDAAGNRRECAINLRELDTPSTKIYALVKHKVERGSFE